MWKLWRAAEPTETTIADSAPVARLASDTVRTEEPAPEPLVTTVIAETAVSEPEPEAPADAQTSFEPAADDAGPGTQDQSVDAAGTEPEPEPVEQPPVPNTIISTAPFGFVTGTAGADVILAYGLRTVATGGGGDDTMIAYGGTAYFRGGDGHDTLIGGAMADTLFGDAGNDRLLVGGGDTAIGGDGADQFIFSTTDKGVVRISDFDATEGDMLVFSKSADVTCTLTEMSNNTTIAFSDGLTVELYGVTLEDINANPDLFGL